MLVALIGMWHLDFFKERISQAIACFEYLSSIFVSAFSPIFRTIFICLATQPKLSYVFPPSNCNSNNFGGDNLVLQLRQCKPFIFLMVWNVFFSEL